MQELCFFNKRAISNNGDIKVSEKKKGHNCLNYSLSFSENAFIRKILRWKRENDVLCFGIETQIYTFTHNTQCLSSLFLLDRKGACKCVWTEDLLCRQWIGHTSKWSVPGDASSNFISQLNGDRRIMSINPLWAETGIKTKTCFT